MMLIKPFRVACLALMACAGAQAADSFQVRILAVGSGNVVLPNTSFEITYDVTGESESDHYYYVDGALRLVRNNSNFGSEPGRFSVTYPGGFSVGTVRDIGICLQTLGGPVCDQVRVRAGYLLDPPQAVEMHAVGVKNHVAANNSFPIHYDVLKPGNAEHYYYVDGQLRVVRDQGSPEAGEFSVTYPGGFDTGISHEVKACVQAIQGETCGSQIVTAGSPPPGRDVPDSLNATQFEQHFVSHDSCDPVCGYYENIFYGDKSVSWQPLVGPDSEANGLRADLYYPTADGRVHDGAARNTLVIYAHSANYSKESVRDDKKSLLTHYLDIQAGAGGVAVAAVDFRHPLIDQDGQGYPLSRDDLSHAVQFFRHHADVFNINPEDIFITGSSLGAGVGMHAAVKELASPQDPSPVRRESSAIRGAFLATGQSSFSQQWFRENFLEQSVWPLYQRLPHDDPARRIYGHAVGNVTEKAPRLELVYEGAFIDHKVTLSEFVAKSVDLTHLPNYGLAMQAQYRLHGIGDRIMVRENYGGSFGTESAHFIQRNRLSGQ
ncbi:MAG: hypothetical protein MI745_10640 [Pseudomonadales bacterium]|nr:hypothetical protein [Pseudomonadales bacterium]